jgi:hypothetical protein
MVARFDTAGTIINDVAVESNLSSVSDPYTSTEDNFVLLRTLLKNLGRKLINAWAWTQFQKEHTFDTVVATDEYDLPTDFGRMIDQTAWDRTEDRAIGILSPEQWQYLASNAVGGVTDVFIRFKGDKIAIWPAPVASIFTVAFEYQSRLWVMPSGETTATLDAPTASTDTILFPPILMIAAMKLEWAKTKGFDTAAAMADFRQVWGSVIGQDHPAPVLSLNGGGVGPRFLDYQNIPETGYGS